MSAATKKQKGLRMPERVPVERNVPLSKTLDDAETARLHELEEAAQHHGQELVKALMEIRDKRLYREEYDTFEEYCEERWNLSKTQINRQIAAEEVRAFLAPIGCHVPNERMARPLAPLLKQPEVLTEVAKEIDWDKATAETVQAAVAQHGVGNGKPRKKRKPPTNKLIIKNTEKCFKATIEALKSLRGHKVVTAEQAESLIEALETIANKLWEYVAEEKD